MRTIYNSGAAAGLVDFLFCVVADGFSGDHLGRIAEVGISFQNGDIITLVVADEVAGSFPASTFIKLCIAIQSVDAIFAIVADDIGGGSLVSFTILCVLPKLRQIILHIIEAILAIDSAAIASHHCWPQESGELLGGVELKGIGTKLKIGVDDDDTVFKKNVVLFGIVIASFTAELCFSISNRGGGFVGSNFSVEVVVKLFGK